MRSSDWVRARVQKIDLYSPPSVASGGRILLRPYNRVRAILRNTDAISQPGTCGPSKNCLVSVPLGAARWAYAIRPYNRVRAIFRNTDAMPQPGMCDSSKYRCDSPTGYVQSFEIPIRSLDRRGGDFWEVGRWGLPFAGETGVNEFGEEEDDDQDYNNEGA